MKKNVSHFGRYFWIKNRVQQHLAWRGHTAAEIRAAVLHGIKLIANGQKETAAFYHVISVAARLRSEERLRAELRRRVSQLDKSKFRLLVNNLVEAMKCRNQKPKVRQLFTSNQQPQTTGPGAA